MWNKREVEGLEQFEEKLKHTTESSEEASSEPDNQTTLFSDDRPSEKSASDQADMAPGSSDSSEGLARQKFSSPAHKAEIESPSQKLPVGSVILSCVAGFCCGMVIAKCAADAFLGPMMLFSALGLTGSLIFVGLFLPICGIVNVVFLFNLVSRYFSRKKKSLLFKSGNTKRELEFFLISIVISISFPATLWCLFGTEILWVKNAMPSEDWSTSTPEDREKKAAKMLATASPDHKAEAHARYGQELMMNDKYDLAKQEYMKASSILKGDPASFELYAETLSQIASIEQRQKHFDKAIETQKEVIKLLERNKAVKSRGTMDRLNAPLLARKGRALGFQDLTVPESTRDLALMYAKQNKFSEAETNFKSALKMALETQTSYMTAFDLAESFAKYLKDVKRSNEIKPLFDTTISAVCNYEDKQSRRSVYKSAGDALRRLGQFDAAIEYLKTSLSYPNSISVYEDEIHQSLGLSYLEQRKFELAGKEFAKQLEFVEGERSASAYRKTDATENIARLSLAEGKLDKAEEYLKKSLSISSTGDFGPNPNTLLKLASVNIKQNKMEIAEKHFKKAIALREKNDGVLAKYNLAVALNQYSKFLRKTTRAKEADALDQRIKTLLPERDVANLSEEAEGDE